MGQLVLKASRAPKVFVVTLDLTARKEDRELSDRRVTPVTLDLLDSLDLLDWRVALEQPEFLVKLDSRVSKVEWVHRESRDPLDRKGRGDHLDRLVQWDCQDSPDFQDPKDSKDLLVCLTGFYSTRTS